METYNNKKTSLGEIKERASNICSTIIAIWIWIDHGCNAHSKRLGERLNGIASNRHAHPVHTIFSGDTFQMSINLPMPAACTGRFGLVQVSPLRARELQKFIAASTSVVFTPRSTPIWTIKTFGMETFRLFEWGSPKGKGGCTRQ